MFATRKMIQHGLLLGACTMLVSATVAVRAMAAEAREPASAQPISRDCKAARQQAWFERQLRVTDGDASPPQPAEPAACAPIAIVHGEPGRTHTSGAVGADLAKERR